MLDVSRGIGKRGPQTRHMRAPGSRQGTGSTILLCRAPRDWSPRGTLFIRTGTRTLSADQMLTTERNSRQHKDLGRPIRPSLSTQTESSNTLDHNILCAKLKSFPPQWFSSHAHRHSPRSGAECPVWHGRYTVLQTKRRPYAASEEPGFLSPYRSRKPNSAIRIHRATEETWNVLTMCRSTSRPRI